MKKLILGLIALSVFISPIRGHADSPIAEARSYWLYETGTEKVLAEYHSELKTPASSLTKLMTCLLTLEAIDQGSLQWCESIALPDSYINPGESSMELEAGETVTVRQLLFGLMIVSANDSAKVLAARLGGDEYGFVQLMNIRAEELGMKQTHFLNANGLPTEAGQNMTSAADIGLISNHLLKTYKNTLLDITGQPVLTDAGRNFSKPATNTLMNLKKGVDGLKTGYTDDAGYCLAATMPFLSRKDARLIAVVMGTSDESSRNQAAKRLLDWAEINFTFMNVIDEKLSFPVGFWSGLASRQVQGHSEKSVERLVGKNERIELTVSFVQPSRLPLRKGDVIGSVTALLPDGERITTSVISDTEILALNLSERFRVFMGAIGTWFRMLLPA